MKSSCYAFSFAVDRSASKTKFFRHFVLDRDREAWGEFTNPRENDPNKMAEGKKENTNRTYLLSIFYEGFRSTAKEGAICD